MITHLISTTEFVKLMTKDLTQQDWTGFNVLPSNALSTIISYANFNSLKPELWMFVPCDEEGNVLKAPKDLCVFDKVKCKNVIGICAIPCKDHLKVWKQAQSKVLFKGWKQDIINEEQVLCYNDGLYFNLSLYDTIDELIQYDLELTETALKQIGLI